MNKPMQIATGPLFPDVECTTCSGPCACGPQECVLRRIWAKDYPHGPMTPEQRAWCVDEADSAAEGAYRRADLQAMTDPDLAYAVIDAWWMYVKSNVEL